MSLFFHRGLLLVKSLIGNGCKDGVGTRFYIYPRMTSNCWNNISALFLFFSLNFLVMSAYSQSNPVMSFKEYIEKGLPDKKELDVFINELSWASFDPEVGYKLGNYMPHDGVDKSATISTSQPNGMRTSMVYPDKPCRINTYGNSFTHCHQVSDGETWQEYLGAHFGEPIRNFGMGGYGVYQAYRRMIREEKTKNGAEYVIFYIWGDDHIRSLLRCRYMLTQSWNKRMDEREGIGKMFHGNFWSNVEMDLAQKRLVERNSLISSKKELYKMTDPVWMYENLKDDLALQMALYAAGNINDIDMGKLKQLAASLDYPVDLQATSDSRVTVKELLIKYSFASTKFILEKVREFTSKNNKKLMVVLFDPKIPVSLINDNTRYDQEIVDYLEDNKFNYFDMNLVHVEDYKSFNLSIQDYYKRYFIGHYNPAGNHFFAFSIKPALVEWLDPKPITYQDTQEQMINFKGYLDRY